MPSGTAPTPGRADLTAAHHCLRWQRPDLGQAVPHLGGRALKQPPAPHREQRVPCSQISIRLTLPAVRN